MFGFLFIAAWLHVWLVLPKCCISKLFVGAGPVDCMTGMFSCTDATTVAQTRLSCNVLDANLQAPPDCVFLSITCLYADLPACVVQGNLSEFVKRVPEAQAYYNLEAASTKFAFPEPGFLEGIKTKDKAILKMARVGFT